MGRDEEKVFPSCKSPNHTLASAIQLLQVVYEKLKSSGPLGRDVLSTASTSGAVGIKIGSLTHYGLLERVSNKVYKISSIGITILMPRAIEEKKAAVAEAARSPSLYQKLIEQFAGQGLPSMLPNILAREYRVSAQSAESVADTFRATMEFAGLLQHGVLYKQLPDASTVEEKGLGVPSDLPVSVSRSKEGDPAPKTVRGIAQGEQYTIPLSRERVAVFHLPLPLTKADLTRIKGWFDLMGEVLIESLDEKTKSAPPEVQDKDDNS